MTHPDCIFCKRIEAGEWILANEFAVAFADGYPISPGHTLVVPREHEADLFELDPEARRAVWALVDCVQADLEWRLDRVPDGYNVGVNVGEAAGQTVPHAHVHVIPRYEGDVPDPRGGVRRIVLDRAAYWKA